MGKKTRASKQKKNLNKTVEPITSVCNLSGLQDHNAYGNELDDCLALMDQSIQATPAPPSTNDSLNKDNSETSTNIESSNCPLQQRLWKGPTPTSSQHASKSAPGNFILPNIQVELARHKQMGDLSKFILARCKHLRMPSFERWIIDSKMEEATKRRLVKEQAEILSTQEAHQESASARRKSSRDEKWQKRMKRKRRDLQSSLEKHLTSSGLRVQTNYDPVIPSMADVEDDATERLMREIKLGAEDGSKLNAKDVCEELCKQACEYSRNLQNLSTHLGDVQSDQYFGKSSGGVVRISLEVNGPDEGAASQNGDSASYSLVYSRKSKTDGEKKAKPFVVKINANHYEKLREMFHAVHDTTTSTRPLRVPPANTLGKNPMRYSPATNVFHHLIFCLLLRYASLSGGQQMLDLRGGGMQGAIHSEVFDCIAKQDGSQDIMECFASPLNVYNSRYFSIFHKDLDWHFGSCGNFFSVPLGFFRNGGVHEANPPFSPGLMLHMVEKMEEHLNYADSLSMKGNECALTFVVVVPSCSSSSSDQNIVHQFSGSSFGTMLKSRFLSRHLVLNAREHGYIEGSQHLRPTRFKESQYNTSIFILQSTDAKEQELESKRFTGCEFEHDVRQAFASRHQLELAHRKKDETVEEPDGGNVKISLPPKENTNITKRKIEDMNERNEKSKEAKSVRTQRRKGTKMS